ncbi:hypothetical protein QBC43DRAFT_79948 [Cladorrhinum sp. PSN259]|nr:hypothetical protein QBC43DRAFT_79948 [Cladorrhinum sp. PSN259]
MFGYGSPTGSASSSYSNSYSSYGSFSSATASPMDIKPSPFSSGGADASCAFPSWPRRSTLSDDYDCYEERVSSYLSDEDLLFTPEVYEDDSSSNASASPVHSPVQHFPSEAELLEMQRQKMAYQREMMKVIIAEKEQRKRQALKRRSGSSKKSKSTKSATMTPIAE